MFDLQLKAIEILKELKLKFEAVAVKADFEAEGIGLEELIFLNRIVSVANLNLFIKIGGCEAVFDLKQAKLFGANSIMVPVVESVFGLKKFVSAAKRVFGADLDFVNLILNVETKTCVNNLEHILNFGSKFLSGIVIGRVDLSSSLNLSRNEIDSIKMFVECEKIFNLAKKFGLSVGLGGGVSVNTYDNFLQKLSFDSFETRKLVFKNRHDKNLFSGAICKATEFEILCLEFKREFFKKLSVEDEFRLELLQERLREFV